MDFRKVQPGIYRVKMKDIPFCLIINKRRRWNKTRNSGNRDVYQNHVIEEWSLGLGSALVSSLLCILLCILPLLLRKNSLPVSVFSSSSSSWERSAYIVWVSSLYQSVSFLLFTCLYHHPHHYHHLLPEWVFLLLLPDHFLHMKLNRCFIFFSWINGKND